MMEKSRNRAVGRQVRKMIAAAMAAMLVFTSANVADVNAEETVLAVSENAVTGETGAGVVEAKKTGEPEVENGGAENREAENIDLDAETADPDTETADGTHTYKNGFCTDDGCDAYEPAVLTTGKYDIDANGEITDSDEAYEIGNAGQLYWFAGLVNGTLTDGTAQNLKANAVLTADITVNEDLLTSINADEDGNVTNGSSFKAWRPMGMADEKGYLTGWYTGIFDGNGHSISGLYVNRDESDDVDDRFKVGIGLFGYYSGLTRNLSVLDSYMRGESSVGGIIGYIGYNKTGTVQNCYSAATVWGIDSIGGICGSSGGISKIENCYNMGNICGETEVGGICGDNHAIIKNCYNVGSVKGEMNVGGITGANTKGNNVEEEITDCYNRGNVTGDRSVGGISGYDRYGLIENCYSQSIVSGNTNVGGICGYGREDTFHNTYYDTNLYVGDAIGYKEGALTTEKTEGKPSQAFESGEIAYLLQADREEPVWGQTLSGNDVQVYPVLGGAKVYQNITYQDCAKDEAHTVYTYANEQKQESYDYTLQEVKAKEPKCTEAGNKAYYKCSVCGKLYTDQEGTNEVSANTVVVPAKGHSFTWIIDREATEQAEGSRHEECSICHEKKAAVAIPKLPSSTQPSESPSQKPSGSPSQKPSESPSQKPSGSPSQQPGQDIKVPAKGTKLTAKGASYQVTSAAEKNPTVVYKGSKKQKASVTIPDTVTIDKVTYKVTSIAANAFKNNKKLKKVVIGKNVTKIGKKAFYGCSKLKKITVKTTKLTKKNVGRQAFKGIHKKATFKVPKKKIRSYRKIFRARGAAKTTKVTK